VTGRIFRDKRESPNVKADAVGFQTRRTAMKFIVCTVIALSVLASVAAPASAALDAKEFWQQQVREHG
jgi:hypothetical protein